MHFILRTLQFAFSRASFPLIVQTISMVFPDCTRAQKQAAAPLATTADSGVFVNCGANLEASL